MLPTNQPTLFAKTFGALAHTRLLCMKRKQDRKAAGRGPKFRTLQPSDRLTRPAYLAQITRYASRLSKTPPRKRRPILLQLMGDSFGVAGEFHVALSVNWLSLCRAGYLDGAFPIGHLCAAFGEEFLIGHAGREFQ